jgi:hypothetical protein
MKPLLDPATDTVAGLPMVILPIVIREKDASDRFIPSPGRTKMKLGQDPPPADGRSSYVVHYCNLLVWFAR